MRKVEKIIESHANPNNIESNNDFERRLFENGTLTFNPIIEQQKYQEGMSRHQDWLARRSESANEIVAGTGTESPVDQKIIAHLLEQQGSVEISSKEMYQESRRLMAESTWVEAFQGSVPAAGRIRPVT